MTFCFSSYRCIVISSMIVALSLTKQNYTFSVLKHRHCMKKKVKKFQLRRINSKWPHNAENTLLPTALRSIIFERAARKVFRSVFFAHFENSVKTPSEDHTSIKPLHYMFVIICLQTNYCEYLKQRQNILRTFHCHKLCKTLFTAMVFRAETSQIKSAMTFRMFSVEDVYIGTQFWNKVLCCRWKYSSFRTYWN